MRDVHFWEERGIPVFVGVVDSHPFFKLTLGRSMTEFVKDLYRRPEIIKKVIAAMTPDVIHNIKAACDRSGIRRVMLMEERASASFFPPEIIKNFWLPYTEIILDSLAKENIIAVMHLDTNFTPLLHLFKSLPRGKFIMELDGGTDIMQAKQVLKDHACIMGDVPATMLATGGPKEVIEYTKKLIDIVGEGGGFILSTGCSCPLDAKPENIKAMIETGRTDKPRWQ
jgi:uroporphyrinogen-III decarboxylase